jgi:hypothetical protein
VSGPVSHAEGVAWPAPWSLNTEGWYARTHRLFHWHQYANRPWDQHAVSDGEALRVVPAVPVRVRMRQPVSTLAPLDLGRERKDEMSSRWHETVMGSSLGGSGVAVAHGSSDRPHHYRMICCCLPGSGKNEAFRSGASESRPTGPKWGRQVDIDSVGEFEEQRVRPYTSEDNPGCQQGAAASYSKHLIQHRSIVRSVPRLHRRRSQRRS